MRGPLNVKFENVFVYLFTYTSCVREQRGIYVSKHAVIIRQFHYNVYADSIKRVYFSAYF